MWQDDLFTSKLNMFVFKKIIPVSFYYLGNNMNRILKRFHIITIIKLAEVYQGDFILIKK